MPQLIFHQEETRLIDLLIIYDVTFFSRPKMERIGLFDGSVEIVIGHRITEQIVAQSLEISNSSTFVIVTDSNIAKLAHLQALRKYLCFTVNYNNLQ